MVTIKIKAVAFDAPFSMASVQVARCRCPLQQRRAGSQQALTGFEERRRGRRGRRGRGRRRWRRVVALHRSRRQWEQQPEPGYSKGHVPASAQGTA